MLNLSRVKEERKQCLILVPSNTAVARVMHGGLLRGLHAAVDERNKEVNRYVLSVASEVGSYYESNFYHSIERRLLNERFDLIFTIGTTSSIMAHMITIRKRIFTPIVF